MDYSPLSNIRKLNEIMGVDGILSKFFVRNANWT